MQITVLGAILVPICLYWALSPARLLQVALIAAVFEAAAAMVLGGFGLQLAMVPGLLFIAYIAMQYMLGMRYPGEGAALAAALPLLALLAYALFSAWFLPNEFAGQVMVWPQRPDPLAPSMVPLAFSSGNVTQPLYLTFNILFAAAVAIFLTRQSISYRAVIGAYLAGGYIVVGLVFWQFASRVAGIPFPDDLLHSNPGWAIVEQSIGSVPRMQGPFAEPSALAGYMSGIVICTLWLSLRGYRIMQPTLLFALALASVLLSTSTTGIITLGVGIPLTLIVASAQGEPGAIARIGKTLGVVVLASAIVVAPVVILRPSIIDSVDAVVESTLSKGDSSSYSDRTAADAGAMATLGETYGLGVGWGSYRSSSFIPGLLANAGIPGILMVLWQIFALIRLGTRGRRASPGHPGQILVDGFSAALCSQFGSALISAPTITSLAFFLQFGCVVGVLARMSIEPDLRRKRMNLAGAAWPPQWKAPTRSMRPPLGGSL